MTGKTKIETRPATGADIERYYGRETPLTVRARVYERDGEVIGVAGYYLINNTAVVFSDSRGEIPKMAIWRATLSFMEGLSIPAICFSDQKSGKFLRRIGWQYAGPSEDGEVYKWQP